MLLFKQCWEVNCEVLTFLEVGFGGNLVQGFRVYIWRAVPSFPQIAQCCPSLALRPQPFEEMKSAWEEAPQLKSPWLIITPKHFSDEYFQCNQWLLFRPHELHRLRWAKTWSIVALSLFSHFCLLSVFLKKQTDTFCLFTPCRLARRHMMNLINDQ